MTLFDSAFLDHLLQQAAASPRLRTIHDLRNSPDDLSQRALNALMPGTQVPIHRHPLTSETVIVVRGSLTEIFYDTAGCQTGRHRLDAATGPIGLQIPRGQFHTVEVHVPTVIVEIKDGPWLPLDPSDTLLPA